MSPNVRELSGRDCIPLSLPLKWTSLQGVGASHSTPSALVPVLQSIPISQTHILRQREVKPHNESEVGQGFRALPHTHTLVTLPLSLA